MVDLSLSEKISTLTDIIVQSPFFLALLFIAVLTIIILIINVKIKKKFIKAVVAIAYTIITIYIFVKYAPSVLDLSDNLVDKVFNAIYFPNLITYICMLLISILLFIRSIIDNNIQKLVKISSICSIIIIAFLFVLVLDTIVSTGINIADKTAVYTNTSLVVLIQSSTAVFTIWCIILVIDLIASIIINHNNHQEKTIKIEQAKEEKLSKTETQKIEEKLKQLETINDETGEFKILTEEKFKESFNKYKKKKKYNEYLKIFGNEK